MTMDPEIEQFRNEAQIDQQKLPNAVERVRQGGALKPIRVYWVCRVDVCGVPPCFWRAAPRRDHCRRAE